MLALKNGVQVRTGTHQSWTHRCYVDTVLDQFRAQPFGKAHEPEFARHVRQQMRHGYFAGDGSDIDNPALAPFLHMRDDFLHEKERSPKMHGHGYLVIFQFHVFDRAYLDDARVIDQHVNLSLFVNDERDSLPHLALIANVANHRSYLDTQAFKLSRTLSQVMLVSGQKH